jgi:hypothetical protein
VVEPSHRTGFATKPFDENLVGREVRPQHLHRDGTAEAAVVTPPNLGHSPVPDDRLELVPLVQRPLYHRRYFSHPEPCETC